MTAGDLICG